MIRWSCETTIPTTRGVAAGVAIGWVASRIVHAPFRFAHKDVKALLRLTNSVPSESDLPEGP